MFQNCIFCLSTNVLATNILFYQFSLSTAITCNLESPVDGDGKLFNYFLSIDPANYTCRPKWSPISKSVAPQDFEQCSCCKAGTLTVTPPCGVLLKRWDWRWGWRRPSSGQTHKKKNIKSSSTLLRMYGIFVYLIERFVYAPTTSTDLTVLWNSSLEYSWKEESV